MATTVPRDEAAMYIDTVAGRRAELVVGGVGEVCIREANVRRPGDRVADFSVPVSKRMQIFGVDGGRVLGVHQALIRVGVEVGEEAFEPDDMMALRIGSALRAFIQDSGDIRTATNAEVGENPNDGREMLADDGLT